MNKQELIEKIKANGEWFETNRYVKITKVIELVNQIDQPQKVKVPAFVAEWIEEVKKRGCGLADALDCFASPIMPDIIKEWLEFNSSVIGCHHDHQELLARAWLDGYEVEEEPKWIVKDTRTAGMYFKGIAGISVDGQFSNSWSQREGCIKFSDKEKAEAVATLTGGTVEKV